MFRLYQAYCTINTSYHILTLRVLCLAPFELALIIAMIVVIFELGINSWIRNRYMDTPFLSAAFQVVVGGLLVFLTGILIGGVG